MFLTILLLLSAIGLSSVAGYYSIAGMTAIFAASWLPIVIMTGTLEFSKVIVASWLYRNWDITPRLLKVYFTSAVVVLMIITSLGIFGYLSKAHIDQIATTSDNPLFIKQIEQQINTEQLRIDDNKKIIGQMDAAVNSMLSQSTAESTQKANKGVSIVRQATELRTRQQKDRTNLNKQIDESNQIIRDLNQQKLKLEQDQIKIEAEVGPIKYIAQLIYGDNLDKSLLEKSVRYVIILIIIVFDPLAVLMFIAANISFTRWKQERDSIQKKDIGHDFIVKSKVSPKATFTEQTLAIEPIENDVQESSISHIESYVEIENLVNQNDMLHSNELHGISKKQDDSTIKRYHKVRLDDAKRTLK